MTAKTIAGRQLEAAVEKLTNEEAFEICQRQIKGLIEFTTNSQCYIIAEAASILMERAESPEEEELGNAIYEKFPHLWDWDADGNYIGAAPLENGYTDH